MTCAEEGPGGRRGRLSTVVEKCLISLTNDELGELVADGSFDQTKKETMTTTVSNT